MSMNRSVIYINGRNGFEKVLRDRLDDSWLSSTDSKKNLVIFWLDANTNLIDLKRAIGSNIIFKYKIQFSADPDKTRNTEQVKPAIQLTVKEKAIIAEMEAWKKGRSEGRPNGRATLDRHIIHLITCRNDN